MYKGAIFIYFSIDQTFIVLSLEPDTIIFFIESMHKTISVWPSSKINLEVFN